MITATLRLWISRAALVGCLAAGVWFFGSGRWLMATALFAAALASGALLLPRGRRGYFIVAAVALSTIVTIGLVFGLDLYLHQRFARTGGYNVWGYRGAVAGRKAPGEFRLVMLGGSVAFGFGVDVNETIPYYLERQLNDIPGARRTSVVNLGWNSEGAYSLLPTLQDYAYLDYDAAILYSGYNDIARNTQVFRHQSALFRLTGYLPILPIIPVRRWLRVDDLSATTRDGKVVFRPTLADRYATEAADTALRITQALEQQLNRIAVEERTAVPPPDPEGLDQEWADYCRYVEVAVRYVLERGKVVVVVSEPYRNAVHIRQQFALWKMLTVRFPDNPRVHYIDMGGAVDLDDPVLSYDGLHLTAAGNAAVANRLTPALWKALHHA